MLRHAVAIVICLVCASMPISAAQTADSSRFDLAAYQRLAVRDREAGIREGRAALQANVFAHAPRDRMLLLWYMGGAAIGKPDLPALDEVLHNLDVLDRAGAAGAASLAGFLRAQRQLDHGDEGQALVTALQAANAVPESDQKLRAIASSELCWTYLNADQPERALEHCRRYTRQVSQDGDAMKLARAQYMEASALSTAKRPDEAIVRWREALAAVDAAGEVALAGRVASGLALDLNHLGKYEEALAMARRSVAAARSTGNDISACIAQGREATALLGLGRGEEALTTIDAALAAMRDIDHPPTVEELLHIKRAALLATHADSNSVASLDEQIKANAVQTPNAHQSDLINALEQRYVEREQALQIRELEQENQRKELDIEAARQRSAELERQTQKQRMLLLVWGGVAILLGVIVLAGLLVIRTQRRMAGILHEQAYRDGLTRLPNRRALLKRLQELETSHDTIGSDAVLVIDIDHFKRVNDGHGHLAGDRVLAVVAHALLSHEPRGGMVGRLGGEEFVILSPNHERDAAMALAERVRKAIAEIRVPIENGQVLNVTASIGVALRGKSTEVTSSQWFTAADSALYQAKAQGRDRVVLASAMGADPVSV